MEEETTEGAYLQNSLLSTLLYGPLYRIRTLLQTQDLIPTIKSSGRPLKGVLNSVKRIYKEEGLRSFWKGGIPLFMIVLYDEAFQIVQNEPLDDLEDEPPKNINLDQINNDGMTPNTETFNQNENMLEDQFAGETIPNTKIPEENPIAKPGFSLSVFLLLWRLSIHPFEVLRVRMASDYGTKLSRQYTGYFSAINSLVKAGGIKSLFKGYIPLTLYAILDKNSLVYFERRDQNGATNILDFLMVETLIYPLSVISSRLMMTTGNPFVKYNGIAHCIKSTYKDFGIKGFYKGFQINLIFYALMVALNIKIEFTDEE